MRNEILPTFAGSAALPGKNGDGNWSTVLGGCVLFVYMFCQDKKIVHFFVILDKIALQIF